MLTLPRYVRPRVLASGQVGFYWIVPTYFRQLGCAIPNEPLGTDYTVACGEDSRGGRAAILNALFDEWDSTRRGQQVIRERAPSMAHWTGFSRNTKEVKPTQKKYHCVPVPITSALFF